MLSCISSCKELIVCQAHEDENDAGKSDAEPATKKRSRGKKDAEDEEKPAATKKAKTGPKKVKPTAAAAADDAASNEELEQAPKKAKSSRKKAKPTATAADHPASTEEDEQAPKKGKAAGKKAKRAAAAPASDVQADGNGGAAPRKTRSGGKYIPAPAVMDESESDIGPKAKVSRKKADKHEKDKSAHREPARADGKTTPAPKGRKAVPKSAERVEDSEDQDVEPPAEPKTVKESKAETKTSAKVFAKDGTTAKTNSFKEKK
jgi:hypothetical protein